MLKNIEISHHLRFFNLGICQISDHRIVEFPQSLHILNNQQFFSAFIHESVNLANLQFNVHSKKNIHESEVIFRIELF